MRGGIRVVLQMRNRQVFTCSRWKNWNGFLGYIIQVYYIIIYIIIFIIIYTVIYPISYRMADALPVLSLGLRMSNNTIRTAIGKRESHATTC